MSAEGARDIRQEASSAERSSEARKASATTDEMTQKMDREQVWQKGQDVPVLNTFGTIESFKDGIYTIDIGHEKIEMSAEGLKTAELENALYESMTASLDALEDTEDLTGKKKDRIEFALEDLVGELAHSGESQDVLQSRMQSAIMEMVQAPYGKDLDAAWKLIKEYSAKREDATKADLNALDFEEDDVDTFIIELNGDTKKLADAHMAGDDEAIAEHGAELFEAASEVALQLKEEMVDATPDVKMQISSTLNRFMSPLSLGARGLMKKAPSLSSRMTETMSSLLAGLATGKTISDAKAELDSISKEVSGFAKQQFEKIRESQRAEMQPVEDVGEIMVSDDGETVIDTSPEPPTSNARPSRPAPRTATAGYGVSMGGVAPSGNRPDYGNIKGGTYSPEQKVDAAKFAVAERGVDIRMNRVSDFMNSEDGRLAILGDPSLGELSTMSVDDYKTNQDLAVAGGFFARRKARKAIKKMDALIAKAENAMSSVANAPSPSAPARAIGAGYQANQGRQNIGGDVRGNRNGDHVILGSPQGELLNPDQTFEDEPTGELLPATDEKFEERRVHSGAGRRDAVSTGSSPYSVPMGSTRRRARNGEQARPVGSEVASGELLDADQQFSDDLSTNSDKVLPASDSSAPTHRARPGMGRRDANPSHNSPYSVSMGGSTRSAGPPPRRRARRRPPAPPVTDARSDARGV